MHYSLLTTAVLAATAMAAPNADAKRATTNSSDFQFPFLTPAFTFEVPITGLYEVGSTIQTKEVVISGTSGTIKTEANFTDIAFAGDLIFGFDFLHDYSGAAHRTLDGHGIFKTSSGTYVSWACTGVTSNTSVPTETETKARGFAHFTFETGDEKLAALSNSVWVGALHFVIGGTAPTLEFKISRVDYINGVE